MASKQGQSQGAQPGQGTTTSSSLDKHSSKQNKPCFANLTATNSGNNVPPRAPTPRAQNPTRRRTHPPLKLVSIPPHRAIQVPRLPRLNRLGHFRLDRRKDAARPPHLLAVRAGQAHGPRTRARRCRDGLLRREGCTEREGLL